ncbi:MAG: hypothetical protein OXU67_03110 [Chloroflexota bacterium]|nr:hypothetical protein [Chloroflexota bacterium]
MAATAGKFQTIHPQAGKQGTNIDAAKYEVMKAALLTVVPADDAGFPFQDLADAVRPHLPTELFANASVSWYVVTVKLDLEARGLIERVPGSRPQRVRRVS